MGDASKDRGDADTPGDDEEPRRKRRKKRKKKRRKKKARPAAREDDANEFEPRTVQSSMSMLQYRRRLAGGATVAAIGVAMVGMYETDIGGWIVLAGIGGMMFAIHTYGRLGFERSTR